ncbi:murein hydrolase activator EnvC family protein [Xanthobacter autotrophicus]|uniref:murein hydrolase activator EnvC family protein n=1 Tax=Xanthobacter autotrophicus TaxID=280 RepID=UPI0024A665C3|nr:peptidoglycan DD-metalloendopeptidase family protein [Xanthobacter autotrophicus]MDI4657849.1 peptidoglycan DD-metalloendopeptidase family protein [Xanthobacter autotrophicus]
MTARAALLLSLALAGLLPAAMPALGQPGAAPAVVPLPPPVPARSGLDTDALKSDLRGTEEAQKRLRAELEAAKGAGIGDRARLNQMLVETATRTRAVEQQLIDVEGRIGLLDGSATDLNASLAKRRGVLAQVLAALMRMGREPPPALLMRPDDALDAVRSAILLGALLPELRVEAETLAADLSELSRVRGELAAARDSLTRLKAELDDDRKRLSALVTERQRRQAEEQPVPQVERSQAETVARSTGDVHDLVTRLETEVGPSARAADAAKAVTRPVEPGKPDLTALRNPARITPAIAFSQAKGLLPLPVAGVTLKSFGAPDSVGGAEKGMTIATRAGAPVSAPADGWVVYAGPFRSYGQLLIINAGGGYHILMAGMERITVDLGQFVLAGEPVGVMGGLSRTAGPAAARGAAATVPGAGLRFGNEPGTALGQPQFYVEFRKDGISIDPTPWWAATDSQKVRG